MNSINIFEFMQQD
jgi:hypothetical protein